MTENLVSTTWLAANLSDPNICILDSSWHMPAAKRNAMAEHTANRIPGSQFFDIDGLSDQSSSLPHMLPTAEYFADNVKALGAGNAKKIICYDTAGLFSAARAWWMFKVFGHDNVAVLNGGFPKWIAENHPVETGMVQKPLPNIFNPQFHSQLVIDRNDVKIALAEQSAQVADARGAPRFQGLEAEPRPGVRAGHMPGAANVHYASMLQPDGTMKPTNEIAAIFAIAGVDVAKPIITSCGSGVTAAILTLALTQLGIKSHSLYDGSWTDWGSAADTDVATGR